MPLVFISQFGIQVLGSLIVQNYLIKGIILMINSTIRLS